MEIIFIIIILLAAVLAVLVLFANRLPNSWTIEKAVLVKTSPRRLYSLLDNLENWQQWTVWNSNNEPSLTFAYPAHRSGVGAVQVWQSAKLAGRLSLSKCSLDREIQYEFRLASSGLVIKGIFAIAASDIEYSQIAWRCELQPVESLNPATRYLAFQLKNSFDLDMEESLANLVALFEPDSNREAEDVG